MRRALGLLLAPLILGAVVTNAGASEHHVIALPSVKGGFGQTPTISYPSTAAPTTLQDEVLHKGNGPVVRKADLLVANYVGQIWRGKTFDSSFARAEPAAFPIGVGAVIPGWDKVLVGMRIGSRVLMVLPPALGYGPSGNSQAGITGTETLVFVVDLISSYNKQVGGDPHATPLKVAVSGIAVSGQLGKEPTLLVTKSAKQPTAVSVKVLDRGSGPKVTEGIVVLQLIVDDFTGKLADSTWQNGTPEGDPVGDPAEPNALDKLVGIRIGSRVLLELPKNSSGGPYAAAIDIIAEPRGTSSQAK